ncbi:right-handed parallel beta-helix repeat-containing protein, partial [Singulisphaera rosea]
MSVASGTMILALSLAAASGPSGRWIGQDGHDYVSTSKGQTPSGYQDMRIELVGLAPGRELAQVTIAGDGGGVWLWKAAPGAAAIAVARREGASTADLYFEPYFYEQGRRFFVTLEYAGGGKVELHVQGGKADPNLRMPGTEMIARWVGQEGQDRVGTGVGVGPDGIQDARIALERLDPAVEIRWVEVEGPQKLRWQSGTNLKAYPNAELVRDPKDRSKAELYFQPDRAISGQALRIHVSYANERGDVARVEAGRFDPASAMPRLALPRFVTNSIQAHWLGQDGSPGSKLGDVHVELTGLPTDKAVAAAVISDSIQGVVAFVLDGRFKQPNFPDATAEGWRQGSDRSRADFFFAPYRDSSNTTQTLRIVFDDGSMTVVKVAGGACDPLKRFPAPASTSTKASPGDDLNELASRYGTVTLAAGTYRLTRPLILEGPITLVGEPGATLLFEQAADDQPWSTAIKIHSAKTTLRDFKVRFQGPIRWRGDVSYGPALVGTTDNFDVGHSEIKLGLVFTGLDIETPPAAKPDGWEDTPRMFRLLNTSSVRIAKNTFKGGVIEFFGGPIEISDNEFRGTVPGTSTQGMIGGHFVNDLVVRGNRAHPVGPSGKAWRFLILTNRGANIRVEENRVENVGPLDGDTIPWANAPEVILTESYRVWFEGTPSTISADGLVVRIPGFPEGAPRDGDFVSILDGPHAGEYRRIAHPIDRTTYLLETPLPKDTGVISITSGFVGMVVEKNRVDSRLGARASNLVLAGNHFGTIVRGNTLLGGEAFRIQACASESPYHWGWSHVPYFGGTFEGNVIEDSPHGGIIEVEHSANVKANRGRTYLSITLRDNTVRWNDEFLRRLGRAKSRPEPGIKIGSPEAIDAGELVVGGRGDRLIAPPEIPASRAFQVDFATFNGKRIGKHEAP